MDDEFTRRLEREKLAALAEFASGAGHEINNPLAIISGRVQLLLRDENDPERRRDLALIHAQVLRVHEMIGDLMLFARPPEPRPRRCDLAALVARLLAQLEPSAIARETVFVRRGLSDGVWAEVDPDQITVALQAIIENAMQAIGNGGQIEVDVQTGETRVTVSVRDNGPGIDPQARTHLFDPFFSGRSAGRGLGLGLSKAWRIITGHGGQIEVAEAITRGAELIVTLPTSPR